MKTKIKQTVFLLFIFFTFSCSKDDSLAPEEIVKSAGKEVVSFSFLSANNTILTTDVIASINTTVKTITINLPSDTPLTALTPTFLISPGASIFPTGEQNFTNPVIYTITAEDGSTVSYTITATSKSSAKQINSFTFLLTNNPIEVNIIADIDEKNKFITAVMPPGTDITGLIPNIEISASATINTNAAQNFRDLIEYQLTAEDGSTIIYTVSIEVDYTQLQILQMLLDDNPEHTLDWGLTNNTDLGNLDGVTTNFEGNIVELIFINKNISTLPSEIGQLNSLTKLLFEGNKLTTLPTEIGKLSNLIELYITEENQFTSLPSEIGQLANLIALDIVDTQLNSLPSEIGQLTNLKSLYLYSNQFTELPKDYGQLVNLNVLDLTDNKLTSLPLEIGQLINLKELYLGDNQLVSLPPEIGFLSNLDVLIVTQNPITSISQEICDLQTNGTLNITADPGEGCN